MLLQLCSTLNGKQMVQKGALTALASVADPSQEHFQNYYGAVIPYLKAILVNANDESNRMLRTKSMECMSLVGMAFGKEKLNKKRKSISNEETPTKTSRQRLTWHPLAIFSAKSAVSTAGLLSPSWLPYT